MAFGGHRWRGCAAASQLVVVVVLDAPGAPPRPKPFGRRATHFASAFFNFAALAGVVVVVEVEVEVEVASHRPTKVSQYPTLANKPTSPR